MNGPTGWLYHNNIKHRLLRVGTFTTSHPIVLEQDVKNGPNKFSDLDDYQEIRRTTSKEGYIGLSATLSDGSILDSNIKYKELDKNGNHYKQIFHRFVVLDSESNEPYTLLLGVLPDKIIFDNPNEWKKIKNTKLKSNISSLISKRHNKERVLAIDKLLLNSNDEGWDSLIPNKNINERLFNSMIDKLEGASRYSCKKSESISDGLYNLDNYAKCKAAKRELSLINEGYSVSIKHTPQAYAYLLENIRSDFIN